jgi:hypothetical protein
MSRVLIERDTSIVPAAFGWFSTAIAERRLRERDNSSDSWGADGCCCTCCCCSSSGRRSASRSVKLAGAAAPVHYIDFNFDC